MDSRNQFLIELLQKLGAPLMSAIAAQSGPNSSEEQDAATIAALLSESVKAGIALSQSMNLKEGDGNADAVRVALANLCGGLIADHYRTTGRILGETDSRRIVKTLESVIVFADNFAPAAEHAARLKTLDGSPPFFDPVQTGLYAMNAMLPVIAAITEFSFGQPEARLAQDVADRLGAKAKDIAAKLDDSGNAMSELVILQSLSRLYASAHRTETARLRAAGDQSDGVSADGVWPLFDRQLAMLETLLSSMSGKSISSSSAGGGRKPDVAAPAEAAPVEAPAASPPSEPTAPPAAPQQPANPMSFFKKK